MTSDSYHTETTYDSRKKKDVPQADPAVWKDAGERALRRHPLPKGSHCGDLRFFVDKTMAQWLKEGRKQSLTTHEQMQIGNLRNPVFAFATLRSVAFVFSIIGLIASFLVEDRSELFEIENYTYFLIPLVILLIGWLGVRYAPNKNNIVLNRRTGMVTIPQLGRKPDILLPFSECDGFYYGVQMTAGVFYNLYLGHRFSPRGTVISETRSDKYMAYIEWEYLQQYMDISKPLPDIPELEPYRHLDPTTAEHDRKTGRPPHYWRDMDLDQVAWEQKKGIEVAKNFHWGMSREQALTSGWQPIVVREERPSPENFVAIDKRGDFEEM